MLLFMTGAKFRKINLIAIAPTCTQLQKDSFSVNFVNYIDKTWNKNLLCLSWQTHSLVLYSIRVIISLSFRCPTNLRPTLHSHSTPLSITVLHYTSVPHSLSWIELNYLWRLSIAVGKYDVTVPVSNGCWMAAAP